jgi:hypothetical protein
MFNHGVPIPVVFGSRFCTAGHPQIQAVKRRCCMIEAQCIRRTDGKTKKHYIVETETEADSNSMTCASKGVHAPSAVDHDMLDMV